MGAASAGGGYEIDQSCRFNDNDSAYTTQTFAGAGTGTGNTCTYSLWLKRGNISSSQYFFSVSDADPYFIGFQADDTLRFTRASGGSPSITTTAVFRDCSAWYHIVLTIDTSLTAVDRWKIYVNNVRQTVTTGGTLAVTPLGTAVAHYIGRYVTAASYFDGYMSEINFVDGTALDPSSFGETNDDGVWVPIAYTGAYGTNGFYLDFSNSSDYGSDQSGNGNDFTDSGLTTTDQMLDTPMVNYPTLNPLVPTSNTTYANGNLQQVISSAVGRTSRATISIPEGKWVYEYTLNVTNDKNTIWGVCRDDTTPNEIPGTSATSYGFYLTNGNKRNNTAGGGSAYGTSVTSAGKTVQIAVHRNGTSLKIWAGHDQSGSFVWQASGDPAAGTNEMYNITISTSDVWFFAGGNDGNFAQTIGSVNFGQTGGFTYTPPTDFLSLNTANLSEPTIKDGSAYFNTLLWTGDGTSPRSITGLDFTPDLIWGKARSTTYTHNVWDIVRGVSKTLRTDTTTSEAGNGTAGADVTSFDSGGFTAAVGTVNFSWLNWNAATYVAWFWKANGAGSSNTDGTINTTATSANTTAGFSLVTYVGNGTSGATIGHGLGVVPNMIIVKNRDQADAWQVYHSGNTAAPETDYLVLNTTAATVDNVNRWNDTAPTSSVFSLGNAVEVNTSSENYVAYCFADVEGFSKMGVYTGNGSANGPFISTGFKPAYVLVKRTDAVSQWSIFDNKREGYNVDNDVLVPNATAAETTTDYLDLLSNGFKARTTDANVNASGGTYVYMAFAENPFGGANTAPATAR